MTSSSPVAPEVEARVGEGRLGALASRLGRRFVTLFSIGALLPLVAFATLSVTRVSQQMEADIGAALHRAAKSSGMSVAARLGQLAGDLRLTADLLRSRRAEEVMAQGDALHGQVHEHCEAVWLYRSEGPEALLGGGAPPDLTLNERQRQHLAGGAPLAMVEGEGLGLLMVLGLGGDGARLVARVRGSWFWDAEELRGADCEFAAYDGRGRALFHTFGAAPRSELLAAGVTRQASSGALDWDVDGEPHIARYWHAFLRPQYGLDLWVLQSRSRAEAFAVDHAFVRSFWLTAACTLLCVVLVSLVQMRRTLDPIVSLRRATYLLGRGDLDARAAVTSRDELGELGQAFNDMAGHLQESVRIREQAERELVRSRDEALAAVKAKSAFVTNVSHEFRTPMAEILSAAEILTMLDGTESDKEREEFSEIALHGARRLARMLDDVLELNEVAGGTAAPTDVQGTLEEAVAALPEAARARVVLRFAHDVPPVVAVSDRLVEVWSRLLDNAVKFSGPDASIELALRADDCDVYVEVTDHGAGIAEEDLPRIFEPFAQVGRDQMTDKAGGAGLGLTLAKATVELLGGSIRVQSRRGDGTTVQVRLPVEAAVVGSGDRAL